MGPIFIEITLIICTASVLAIIFRFFKQPPILAYILTGMIVVPFGFVHKENLALLSNFSELGITLLLFLLGLEFKLGELKSIGKVAIISASLQVVLTTIFGFCLSFLLHFSVVSSLYIALAVTFSSTIIIVKLLADKKDLHSLYGRIAIGFSLVQDLFAILFLMLLSGYKPGTDATLIFLSFFVVLIKGVILFTLVVYLSKTLVPYIIHRIARSEESLFLFSLAWVFGISALVSLPIIGFSIEIGGFLAGIALANSVENFSIVAKIRPLRDFFVTLFFVFLGSQLGVGNISIILIPAILLAIFTMLSKPLIMMLIMGFMGYRKRTSFLTGLSIAPISEFSLIIILLGFKLGHISTDVVSLITVIGIVTFSISTYFIIHSNSLYSKVRPYLNFVEMRKGSEEKIDTDKTFENHVLLIGGTKMGPTILEALENAKDPLVVVDFNPDVVKELQASGITTIFGDIIDPDIQEKANIEKAKLVVSTLTDFEDNLLVIKAVRHKNKGAKIVVVAYDPEEAKELYEEGVDYVVLPHIAGGRQLARTLRSDELEKLEELREKDKKYLG